MMFSIEDKIKIGSFNKALYRDVFEKSSSEDSENLGLSYKELHNVGILRLKFFPIPMYNNSIATGFESELTTNDLSDIIAALDSNELNYFGIGFTPDVSKPSNLPTILDEKFGLEKKYSVITHIRSMEAIPNQVDSFHFKEISAADDVYYKVAKSGFGIPDEHANHFKTVNKYFYGDSTRRSFLALKNNIPITVGQFYYNNDLKMWWLGNESTKKEYQNQGGQTAMICHRLMVLQDLGCEYAVTETMAMEFNQSSHNLRKLGFSDLFTTDYYVKKEN